MHQETVDALVGERDGPTETCNESKTQAEEESAATRDFVEENATEAQEILQETLDESPDSEAVQPIRPIPDSAEPVQLEPLEPGPLPPQPVEIVPPEEEPVGNESEAPQVVAPGPQPEPAAPIDRAPEPVSVYSAESPSAMPRRFEASPEVLAAAAAAAFTWIILGPAALYNRLTKARVEGNRARTGILDLIKRRPGSTPTAISRQIGLHVTTVSHHLRILAKFGAVVLHAEKAQRRCFENHGRVPVIDRPALSCLQRQGHHDFLKLIGQHSQMRLADVASRLGISTSTAGYRASGLVRAGLLVRTPTGWQVSERAQRLQALAETPAFAGQTATNSSPLFNA